MTDTVKSDMRAKVESLIAKAEKAPMPLEAMQFSQAALNSANALSTLENMPAPRRDPVV